MQQGQEPPVAVVTNFGSRGENPQQQRLLLTKKQKEKVPCNRGNKSDHLPVFRGKRGTRVNTLRIRGGYPPVFMVTGVNTPSNKADYLPETRVGTLSISGESEYPYQ